jgi:hypothetical protein
MAKHGTIRGGVGKITTMCYLFSLSTYVTALAAVWLSWSGQLSSDGQPVSAIAKMAFLVAGESIKFQHELAFIAVLMSIVIVPQLINYFVAGMFGAAGSTQFSAWCLRVIFWSILKGLAVAGGVCLSWGLVAAVLHWPRAYEAVPSELVNVGLIQIAITVLSASFAVSLEDNMLAALTSMIRPMVEPLMPIHRWLTRRKAPSNEQVNSTSS